MSDPNVPPPPGGGAPPPPPGGFPPAGPPAGPPPGQPPYQPPPPGGGGYGGPPGGFTPPPAQPYGGGNTPQLDVGSALSYGWEKFQQFWKEFVLLQLAMFVAVLVVVLIAFLAVIPASTGTDTGIVVTWILSAVIFFVIFALAFILQAGVLRAGLGVTRGQTPSIEMLKDTTNLGPYILTVLLVGLGVMIGSILCILPGIAFGIVTAYAPLLSLDKGMGAVDAIKRSYEMVMSNLGQVLLILLVSYLVYYVGSLACGIGVLVTAPIALVMICYSYRALNNEPVAP